MSLFQNSTPSVVNITNVAALRDRFTLDITKIPRGTGSGFVWDKKGHVVTNYHVIKVMVFSSRYSTCGHLSAICNILLHCALCREHLSYA